ncbi:RNA methyltransferase [Aneurinibacillus sp. Ricciae_BoGa-3]|uniref:TrmH family RNA methyltransferase n=1 Tax=Aneurinibacillus sp. Ricciae_BoGa-3 TaxID=3022697 RepID=UPI00234226FE|nr:RNA methyltransferase [Aneurinibacillus sp. Ricciae_BoGa-3]WCK53750.1 RNA methyltransferase [Aneurinibacillus sp. Ricciae_BoGa-3]
MEIITSAQNPRVKQWSKLQKRKEREQAGLFLIEGPHLVEEACRSGADIESLLLEEGMQIPRWLAEYQSMAGRARMYWVSAHVLSKLSETQAPQGIMAVIRMPDDGELQLKDNPMLLLVDRLQDPGNLGTLIRTADAADFDGVVVGDGSVDLYNSKTVRSTMGSLFHIPVWRKNLAGFIAAVRKQQPCIRVIGTSLHESLPYTEIDYSGPIILVIGNEGSGMSEDLLQITDQNVIIPLYGRAESLNAGAAGSILMYEAVRQRNLRKMK